MPRTHTAANLHRAGALLLVVGGLALAFAAWGIGTLATPAEEVAVGRPAEPDLFDRFRLRLEHNARLQGSGLGLLAAGAVLVATSGSSAQPKMTIATAAVGVAASALIIGSRWASIGTDQFATRWDHWVLTESVAWFVWVVALVALVLPRIGGATEPSAPEARERS